ncbi:MAG: hypothetical protein ACREJC_18895, partial [Tepidisphaeraceae bacterium]
VRRYFGCMKEAGPATRRAAPPVSIGMVAIPSQSLRACGESSQIRVPIPTRGVRGRKKNHPDGPGGLKEAI